MDLRTDLSPAPFPALGSAGSRPATGVKKQLLVVEDDEMLRHLILHFLHRFPNQLEATFVDSGEKAVEILRSSPVDVLLADFFLPGIDGVAVMFEALRLQPRVRVVVMTSSTLPDLRDLVLAEGAVGFLQKPLRLEEFGQILQAAAEPAETLRTLSGQLSVLDLCLLSTLPQKSSGIALTTAGGASGVLVFGDGNVLHASCPPEEGIEALRTLLAFKDYDFRALSAAEHQDYPANLRLGGFSLFQEEVALGGSGEAAGATAGRALETLSRVRGRLSGVAFRDLLHLMQLGRKTGLLTLTHPHGVGVLFVDGELIDAETSQDQGLDAACEIVGWESLDIEVTAGIPPDHPHRIDLPLQEILRRAPGAPTFRPRVPLDFLDAPASAERLRDLGDGPFTLAELVSRFCREVPDFVATDIVRLADGLSLGGGAADPGFDPAAASAASAEFLRSHNRAIDALGGPEEMGDTEDILVTTSKIYLMLRCLGDHHYHALAMAKTGNPGLGRMVMKAYEPLLFEALRGMGEL